MKILIRPAERGSESTKKALEWVLSPKVFKAEFDYENVKVVEYAVGYEYHHHTPHAHVVLRLDRQVSSDVRELREIWELENYPEIQDIRTAYGREDFDEAAKYACKSGDYDWPSQDIPEPYNIEEPNWNPVQRAILDSLGSQNNRKILCVVDKTGNNGKTFLAKWHSERFRATRLSVTNNYKDIMRMAYCYNKRQENLSTVYIDIPKSYPQNALNMLFAAAETLKDGDCWDDRYEHRHSSIRSPKLCVFTNTEPDIEYLTKDRWTIFIIQNHKVHEKTVEEYEHEAQQRRKAAYQRKYRQNLKLNQEKLV